MAADRIQSRAGPDNRASGLPDLRTADRWCCPARGREQSRGHGSGQRSVELCAMSFLPDTFDRPRRSLHYTAGGSRTNDETSRVTPATGLDGLRKAVSHLREGVVDAPQALFHALEQQPVPDSSGGGYAPSIGHVAAACGDVGPLPLSGPMQTAWHHTDLGWVHLGVDDLCGGKVGHAVGVGRPFSQAGRHGS
jgi:hypothetical protein